MYFLFSSYIFCLVAQYLIKTCLPAPSGDLKRLMLLGTAYTDGWPPVSAILRDISNRCQIFSWICLNNPYIPHHLTSFCRTSHSWYFSSDIWCNDIGTGVVEQINLFYFRGTLGGLKYGGVKLIIWSSLNLTRHLVLKLDWAIVWKGESRITSWRRQSRLICWGLKMCLSFDLLVLIYTLFVLFSLSFLPLLLLWLAVFCIWACHGLKLHTNPPCHGLC